MDRNSFNHESRARELEALARECGQGANRDRLAHAAMVLRRKAQTLVEGTTLRMGEPMVADPTSRIWWVTLLRALAAIVLGVLTLVWPRHSARALLALFGGYAIFDGVALYLMAARATARRKCLTIGAAVNVLAGLVALSQPRIFALLLFRVLGGWLIFRSVAEVVSAPSMTRTADAASARSWRGRSAIIINGMMSALFGVGLIAAPTIGALGLMWAIGAWAVLHGLLMAPFALRLRSEAVSNPPP